MAGKLELIYIESNRVIDVYCLWTTMVNDVASLSVNVLFWLMISNVISHFNME